MLSRVERQKPNHKTEKLRLILGKLKTCSAVRKYELKDTPFKNERIFIYRDSLQEIIMKELNLLDHVTILAWCKYLLAHGFIEQNPTSNITPNGHRLPTNDTRYFICIEEIDEFLKNSATPSLSNFTSSNTQILTRNRPNDRSNLDNVSDQLGDRGRASELESASPKHQTAIKDTLSES